MFTYAALKQMAPPDSIEILVSGVLMVLRLVRSDEVNYAVVPIESSVEGGVDTTLDALTDDSALQIRAEMLVPITFLLAVRPGTRHGDIRVISAHSHTWAQCRGWITERLGPVVHVPVTSTVAGAKTLTESDSSGFETALYPPATVRLMGPESLSNDVAGDPGAVIRFIMVDLSGPQPERTDAGKATLLIQLLHDEAGALLNILEQFSAHGINLSRIESRPIGNSLGRYASSTDVEGHLCDKHTQAALISLHRVCPQAVLLGLHPSASGEGIGSCPGASGVDFQTGCGFTEGLLAGQTQEDVPGVRKRLRRKKAPSV